MELSGARECRACGTRWSYFEIGGVSCPDCGSLRSVGVGDRTTHTAGPASLDLTAARRALDEESLTRAGELAAAAGRAYRRKAGFLDAGRLEPLSSTYLLAAELETVGGALARSMRPADATNAHFLSLLGGDRPAPEAVPTTLQAARGLAVTRAVRDFLRDLRSHLDDRSAPLARRLSTVTAHRKRIEALDGDVDPTAAERLVGAAGDLHAYVVEDDEAALARIDQRFDR